MAQAISHVNSIRPDIPVSLYFEVHRDVTQARLDLAAPFLGAVLALGVAAVQNWAGASALGKGRASKV